MHSRPSIPHGIRLRMHQGKRKEDGDRTDLRGGRIRTLPALHLGLLGDQVNDQEAYFLFVMGIGMIALFFWAMR